MWSKKLLLLIILILGIVGSSVEAFTTDSLLPATRNHLLEYTLVPEDPQPNQLVTLELRSYHFDMNSADVFVYLDNELVKNEKGLKKYTFSAPNGNVRRVVTVIAEDIDGQTYRHDIVIQPVEVTLVYEVDDAYRPPFYDGKAYALSNSRVKFKAFADFANDSGGYISSDNLIYDWYVNFEKDYSASGIGKDIFTIDRLDAYPIETIVQVKVADARQSKKGSSALFLLPRPAVVDFYAVPLVEPFKFKNILEDGTLTFNEFNGQIRTVPYFMDGINDSSKPITYEWRVNGQKIFKDADEDLNVLDIAVDPDTEVKEGEISLSIQNKTKPFQYSSSSFRVKFLEAQSFEEGGESIFNRSGQVETGETDNSFNFFGLF